MGTDLEVALVRAGCRNAENQELYWIFSRAQLEFVLKELELVDSSNSQVVARYQEMVLPVLSLEQYFGFSGGGAGDNKKFMVLRSVDENKKLQRLIVQSDSSPQFLKLTNSFSAMVDFSTPKNSGQIRGAYSLGRNKVGVVPDMDGICQAIVSK